MYISAGVILTIIIAVFILVFFLVGTLIGRSENNGWKNELLKNFNTAKRVRVTNKPEAIAAIVTMDAYLDKMLTIISHGDTLSQRLKNAEKKFSPGDYNDLWEAHKIRNIVVHEPGKRITTKQIAQATKVIGDICISYLKS